MTAADPHMSEIDALRAAPLVPMRYFAYLAVSLAVMIAVIVADDHWSLNFVHVIAGILWTGIDLFMGFVVGPVIRTLAPPVRRLVILRLMPKMLLLMPALAIITSTTGWYLSVNRGYLDLDFPELWWFIAALVIVAILTVQGIGILLPTNLRVLIEMRTADPDFERVGRWMRRYVRVIASQAVMQVAIVLVMARFVTGL